jgi:hypothetical protein
VIHPTDLHAIAGKVEQSDTTSLQMTSKRLDSLVHLAVVKIMALVHHKTEAPQCNRHDAGIVHRGLQRGSTIGTVANDQCKPEWFLGGGCRRSHGGVTVAR